MYKLKKNGEVSLEVALIYDLLRFVNNKSYNVKKANEYNEKSIAILRNLKNEEYTLADTLKSRAFSYLKERKKEEAKVLLEEVVSIYDRILPDNHYKIGNLNIALARLYYQLEDYKKSYECAKKAVELLSLKYDRQSTDVATALMALGLANCKLGNFEEGINNLKETLKTRIEKFHDNDFAILDAYESLADGYIDAKDYKEARKYLMIVKDELSKKVSVEDKWYKRIEEKLKCVNEN